MAASNQMWHKIETELVGIQKSLNKARNIVQQLGAAIEDSKDKQNTIASAGKPGGELQKVLQELQKVEAERKQIKKQFHNILENNTDVQTVETLKHNMHQFGCELLGSFDENNEMIYKFDFGNERCISFTMNASRLQLVHIYPEQPNFVQLKERFHESQDLIGLLKTFADIYKNVSKPCL